MLNATIYRADELENGGEYAEVQLVSQRVANAQKTCTKKISQNVYNSEGDSSDYITGLLSLTSETTSTPYGGIAEADLVASDGTYPWEGKTTTTSEAMTLDVIRTMRTNAKLYEGANGKPDVVLTTETLWNILAGILQAQQRFTSDSDTAKAGFTNLVFEGAKIVVDDFCPSGYAFALNSKFIGFAVHSNGYFVRDPWANLVTVGVVGKSMKIFWDGNIVCSNRKAHIAHSSLS